MCKVCGCGNEHIDPAQVHRSGNLLDFGGGPAHAHAPGLSQARMVQIEQDVLHKNDAYAALNRSRLEANGVLTINFLSSPGSGKTTLLVESINRLKDSIPIAVIEGDQRSSRDSERIRATGVPSVQINTGKGCHLDAHMVGHALDQLPLEQGALLFVENVGNLVCPAGFDLGENNKVVILSVAEGDDKPVKYPDMFAAADLVLLSKLDLLPYVDFDLKQCCDYLARLNSEAAVLELSARSGEGLDAWLNWLLAARDEAQHY